jgi:four helix bundle protein
MNKFKDLNVWKKAIELTTMVYNAISNFPTDERYGLSSQIKRSVVSIPANIAEGSGRNSKKEFSQFLGIAIGSSYELQTLIIISRNLNLIEQNESERILSEIDEILRMIYKLQLHLNKTDK